VVSISLETETAKTNLGMKKAFLKITVVCAACSMLGTSAWAQSESQGQQPSDSSANRSWSTKHLSATGRDGEHAVRATQLSGATVNDSSGQRIATIEDTIINPAAGRVDFALLSLNGAAAKSSSNYSGESSSTTSESSVSVTSSSPNKLVPVPWSLLKASASSSQYMSATEKPTFTLLNIDQNKLNSAPSVSASDLSRSEWQQRVYSYYGVTPGSSSTGTSSMGASESPTGEIKGEGARHMENSTPERQQPAMP
jgi:sporulation protein YlmC with PRC-barrel domain